MKSTIALTLALSIIATGALAEDGFDRTNAHALTSTPTQSAYAEDGFDRTNGARFAEDGFDRTQAHSIG
ncbi:heme utilization protein [Pseudomonas capeferrum]|nr:heme utilization protein [Pseudomonas capeferrum]